MYSFQSKDDALRKKSRLTAIILQKFIYQHELKYHLVFPFKSWVLTDFSRILMDAVYMYVNEIVKNPVSILGIDPNERLIWELTTGRQIDSYEFFRNGIHFFMNIGFLLSDSPPIQNLVDSALSENIAFCGSKSTKETYAFACSFNGRQGSSFNLKYAKRLWPALSHLTACHNDDSEKIGASWDMIKINNFIPIGKALFENSPSMHGIKDTYSKPWRFSSQYMNTAFKEIFSNPKDFGFVGTDPIYMVRALLAQCEVSDVPWIFNSLINAIEFRVGVIRPSSFPPEIHLSLTGDCNIECKFCGYTHNIARSNYVNLHQIDRMTFLKYAQSFRLNSGHGEPTLNKNLPAIIKRLSEKFPHLSLTFFTNAIFLDSPGLLDTLVGNVDWINASINASTKQSWKDQCSVDKFDRVCRNLRKLNELKRSKGSLLPLVFGSMVANKANFKDIPRMPALCRELGIDRFSVFAYFALGYSNPEKFGPDMTLESNRNEYDQIYIDTLRNAREYGISLELPPLSEKARARFGLECRAMNDFANIERNEWPLDRFLGGIGFSEPHNRYCHFLWRYAAIGSTYSIGHSPYETHYIYPCIGPLSNVDLSRRTAFRFPDKEGFIALWHNPILTHLRYAQRESGICEVCDFCRHNNTRNPQFFKYLERSVAKFAQEWR